MSVSAVRVARREHENEASVTCARCWRVALHVFEFVLYVLYIGVLSVVKYGTRSTSRA